ncbi:glutathione S-transferase theta-1 isoform X1 [Saccopteryx leptura]|uniref:glutathione S-transferase theta-1 isoform X1 n=2 Tax=Saccopteryx leptura TaxID=249018 RepID=UPI00339C6C4D
MVVEIYMDLLSASCRSVYIFARKNSIPFDFQFVDLLKGHHHSKEYVEINPLRTLPSLKDGKFILSESVPILFYLCRKYSTPSHWYPPDLHMRARVDEYLSWQHTAIQLPMSKILWIKVLDLQVLLAGEFAPPDPAMGQELFLDLLSQPCRAVYIFAKKNGIPFELRTVELLKGQHLSNAFAQINPLKKVPVLKDGDFTLTESVAILLYLTRKYKVPDHWYPQDLQARARVDEYLAWQHTTLRRNCLRALWHKTMFPVFLGEAVSPEMLAATLAELDVTLQILEDKFLQNKAFLVGPHISLADLVAITELMHPVGAGCQIFEGRPKLAAWRQRVEAAVGADLFQEAHEIILKAKNFSLADPSVKQKVMPRVRAMIH